MGKLQGNACDGIIGICNVRVALPVCTCRDASGMVLHKESQWYQSWQSFKDNNQFVHSQYSTLVSIPLIQGPDSRMVIG